MNYKKYNDYELIYMVRENNIISRDLLYEKYQPILRKISGEFYRKYKHYGYEYDDFLQEANLLFEKAIINYNENRNNRLYSFVILCVKRGLISFCKSISSDNKHNLSYYYVDIDKCNIADNKSDISYIMEDYTLKELMSNIILELSIEDSSILELRYNGFSYREIGVLLNIPSSTVEYRLRKIRKLMKKYYCKETI